MQVSPVVPHLILKSPSNNEVNLLGLVFGASRACWGGASSSNTSSSTRGAARAMARVEAKARRELYWNFMVLVRNLIFGIKEAQ